MVSRTNRLHDVSERPIGGAPPSWSQVVRALRVAQGATQAGWGAQLAVSRATVQRWESGEAAPDPAMERALIAHCVARGLLRTYDAGPLAGTTVTAEWLTHLLTQARMAASSAAVRRAPAPVLLFPVERDQPAGEPAPVAPDSMERPSPAGVSIVGRETELGALGAALARARAGHGSLVLIGGEAGIGKTALCETLAAEAGAGGAAVLWGRCWEGEGAPALWPWMQPIAAHAAALSSDHLRADLGAGAADIAQLVPEVRAALPDLPAPPPTDPEAARFRLFGAVDGVLARLAARRPLVLILEDLHWADAPSLMLLRFVAQRLGGRRLLLAATYRDVEVTEGDPLAETLAALRRAPGVGRLSVGGLAPRDVTALVSALAGDSPDGCDGAIAGSLHRATGGNPLFIREYVRHLAETGSRMSAHGRVRDAVAGEGLPTMPEGVRDVIGGRLARLSAGCREALSIAAVAGDAFAPAVLRRVAAALPSLPAGDALLDALDEAEAARLVRVEGGAGRYRFAHALIREATYAALPSGQRGRLHGWMGEALEEQYRDRSQEHAAELAHHFGEAAALSRGYATKAVAYGALAGAQAEAATDWDGAARRYERCLSLMTELGEDAGGDEAALLGALGRCQRNLARWRDAWRNLMRARAALSARGEAVAAARVTLDALAIDVPPRRRTELVEEALTTLAGADPVLEARLLAQRVAEDRHTPATDALARRAGELADRYDIGEVRALLARREGGRALVEGRGDEALARYRLAHDLFASAGQTTEAARPLLWAAAARVALGDLDAGAAALADALAYARSVHAENQERHLAPALANLAMLRGDMARYDALLLAAADLHYWVPMLRSRRAELAGDLDAADALIPDPATAGGVPSRLAFTHGARARLAWRRGRDQDARRELARWAATLAPENGTLTDQYPYVYAEAVEPLAALGDDDAVAAAYRKLTGWPHLRVSPWTPAGFDAMRGALALRLGLDGEAERHYHTGLAWAERERCPVEAGRCLLGLAEVAARHGRPDDAAVHRGHAARHFQTCGATLFLHQANAAHRATPA